MRKMGVLAVAIAFLSATAAQGQTSTKTAVSGRQKCGDARSRLQYPTGMSQPFGIITLLLALCETLVDCGD